jgi:hypothetical protein
LPAGLDVKADRVNPAKFYALDAASKTLYGSTDGGNTFRAINTSLPSGASEIEAAPGREGEIWLTGTSGLQRSTDGGKTFVPLTNVTSCDAIGFGKAAPGRQSNTIFISGKSAGVSGIFRSTDDGATWERINDEQHQWGWTGASITGDPRVFGRLFIGTNGRGIIWGEPK